MKAWVLSDIGKLELKEIPGPVPGRGEALIRVSACGICGSDIPRVFVNGAHNMPIIPGHEFAGVVEEVVGDLHKNLIGKRVGVFPLIPCKKCRQCLSGHTELCRNYNYLGSRRDGAFAEYVAAPVENLIELPENVPLSAAAMLEPASVGVHAIKRSGLLLDDQKLSDEEREKSIVVCGIGTIGMLILLELRDAGYKNLYAIGNKDLQQKRFVDCGFDEDHFCNSKAEDVLQWITDNSGGADVFFECVGNNDSLRFAIDCTNPMGSVVLVGNPHSDMALPQDVYWKILRNQLYVTGSWNSSFDASGSDDWKYIVSRLSAGLDIESLITHRYGIDDLYQGFLIMRDKTEDYCKVMMELKGC